MVEFENFQKLEICVGKIIEINDFPEARKPAYKLRVDFGDKVGVKNSSVQICKNYSKKDLIGKRILGIVNLHSRQIGNFISEFLALGVPDEKGECVLVIPDKEVPIGGELY